MWGSPATLSFFHGAFQLHSVHAPRWGSGSHLQDDECWCLTYYCIRAQKPWQRKHYFNLGKKKKKKRPGIPPACSVFSTSSSSTLLFSSRLLHMELQPARTGITGSPVSAWGPTIPLSTLMEGWQHIMLGASNCGFKGRGSGLG